MGLPVSEPGGFVQVASVSVSSASCRLVLEEEAVDSSNPLGAFSAIRIAGSLTLVASSRLS